MCPVARSLLTAMASAGRTAGDQVQLGSKSRRRGRIHQGAEPLTNTLLTSSMQARCKFLSCVASPGVASVPASLDLSQPSVTFQPESRGPSPRWSGAPEPRCGLDRWRWRWRGRRALPPRGGTGALRARTSAGERCHSARPAAQCSPRSSGARASRQASAPTPRSQGIGSVSNWPCHALERRLRTGHLPAVPPLGATQNLERS
jgi:hypothetical protein